MTELQKVEFDLLKMFAEICDKLNLKYYLVCGSALGAAKYKGFIPWDDDIDVAMLRDDYETFINKAVSMLPDGIFLQNYHTEKAFPQFYSKLRNSNTTFIEKSVAHLPINHGVFIDIFPLDGYPKAQNQIELLEKKKRIYQLQLNCVYNINYSKKEKLIYKFERLIGLHKKTNKTVNKLDMLLSFYPCSGSDLLCNHGNWQGKLEYAPKEQYGEGIWAEFEGLKVRIPEKFDEYLTQKYGDWRADLPEELRQGHHSYTVCDLTKPYTEYLKNEVKF